jgi:two-component sensor histidine kinase
MGHGYQMPISSRYVVSSTVILLAIGFLALLGIVGTSLWLGERAQLYFTQVIDMRNQRTATFELRTALYAAESSQRGFLVTGNEIYLSPFDIAKSQAQRHMSELRRLFAALPDASAAIDRLGQITAEKFAEMDESITLKRARHDEEALALFRTNKGKALMDEANVFFSGLIQGTDQRLELGMSEQRTNAFWQRLVAAVGAVVIVLVVAGATWVIARYTLEVREARDEVSALNADLERRVSDRTLDLVIARDRATALLSEVNHRIANSLTLVSSLVGLQAKAVKDDTAKQALAETQDRIFAISLVHKRLYGSTAVGVVQLDDYLAGLLEHLKTSLRSEGQGVSLVYDVPAVPLATDASINLGVVVTEWVTNAFKYAYPDGVGEVRVTVRELPDGMLELAVEDDGVGRAEGAPAKGTGLGTKIVTAMATSMKATIDYPAGRQGTSARLTFPRGS